MKVARGSCLAISCNISQEPQPASTTTHEGIEVKHSIWKTNRKCSKYCSMVNPKREFASKKPARRSLHSSEKARDVMFKTGS